MFGWGNLKNWFKRLFKAEQSARDNAPESSFDSPITSPSRNTPADWEAQRRRVEDAKRARKEQETQRRRLEETLERLELEEQERTRKQNRGGAFSSDEFGGGNLSPNPTARSYGGNVPARQLNEHSALWILRGQFHLINGSDNVYAIAYNLHRSSLFVQYKHWAPGMAFGAQHGPGPIYEYKNVSVAEAHAIYKAKDVGAWLWDNIRVRGTWGEHKKPYRLVAISQQYLPRKATWGNDGREWFIRRQMWGTSGQAVYSQLPNAPAPPMGYDGKPDRSQWRPDRGNPNRGRPNRGK